MENGLATSEQKSDYILDATGNSSRNSCTLVINGINTMTYLCCGFE
jgi:hypothetical protein